LREEKKKNIKLRSLTRRAAEEIRDLDNILIDCVENNKIPQHDEEEPMFAGFSSINLLNRLDGRTNGGYIENYDDLALEMNKDTKGNHLEPSEDSLLLPPSPLNNRWLKT